MLKNGISQNRSAGSAMKASITHSIDLVTRRHASHGRCAGGKRSLACSMFLAMIFFAPSLRADIVYDVPVSTAQYPGSYFDNYYAGNYSYFGNTFSTTSNTTKIKSISLYLNNLDTSASGSANLKIYNTKFAPGFYGEGGYVPTGSSLGEASIDRTTISNVSDSSTPPTSSNLYTFNFTGSNAINLEANTRYAFMFETVKVGIWTNYSNPTSENFFEKYFDTNGGIYDNPGTWASIAGKVEVEPGAGFDPTAVPEPGTLILTGSALLAGAIGVYVNRRRKDQALTPATA